MLPVLDSSSEKPLFEQIYLFYKNEIHSKNSKAGTRMPSLRQLAVNLGVSNNTIIRAYEQLLHEGYLVNRPRQGLYIEKLDKINVNESQQQKKSNENKSPKVKYNLSHTQIDRLNFPLKAWRKMSQQALDNFHNEIYNYEEAAGLKEEIAKYLYASRGVRSTADQIIICSGTNMVATFLSMLFRESHKQLIFEDPGYKEVRSVFEKNGFSILPVPVTKKGIDLNKLPNTKSNLIYVIPSHQYPTGVVMPVQQRIKLTRWAEKTDSYIIEDDYDSEFRYRGKPIPSLQAIDQSNRVIYAGTFSKVLMPTLRVAYLVLPKNLKWKSESMNYMAWSVSYSVQKTLALFMQQGYCDRHIRRMRKVYKTKYYETEKLFKKVMGDRIRFDVSHAGIYFILEINSNLSVTTLVEKAAQAGIRILSTEGCYLSTKKKPKSFFFGFGDLSEGEIENVIRLLKKAWFS
jgi:GntR family transcriptional regulator / MocR family aminotransferase